MPVLVTGAAHAVGRACARALLRAGGEVRVFLDPEAAPQGALEDYRAQGAKVARGTLDDEGRLELALEQVHTVVHAAADPFTDPEVVLDDLASVASAALGAGCRRIVLVSHLGADDARDNAWLAALAEAEALLAEAPLDTVVIRRALTYGPDDQLTEAVRAGAAGSSVEALHAPLWVDDLAAAAVAADARHRRAGVLPHLLVPLGGPEVASLAELIALLGGQVTGGQVTGGQVTGGQVTGGQGSAIARPASPGRRLPPHVGDLLSRDLLPPKGALSAGTSPRVGCAQVRAAARRS